LKIETFQDIYYGGAYSLTGEDPSDENLFQYISLLGSSYNIPSSIAKNLTSNVYYT